MKTAYGMTALAGVFLTGSALAQSPSASLGLFVYPSGGQTAEQQSKDEQECIGWAQQNTAPPPGTAPEQAAPPPQADTAAAAGQSAVRTAAKYALLADVTGNENDMSEAAAVGAVVGARRGAASARQRNAQAQQQATQQQQAATQQQQQNLKNAFSACIEGRSYTIR